MLSCSELQWVVRFFPEFFVFLFSVFVVNRDAWLQLVSVVEMLQ